MQVLSPLGDGGARIDIIVSPSSKLFSETNHSLVAILLTYGTARALVAGDAEAKEEHIASGPCMRS
jgi:competence protein ComEC